MKTAFLLTTLLCVLYAERARGQGEEDALKKRFLSEYPEAINAWRAQFANAQGRVRRTSEGVEREDSLPFESVRTFKCMLPEKAIEIEVSPKGEHPTVHGYNSEYSFVLRRADPSGAYAILSLKPASGRGVPKGLSVWTLLWSPYSSHARHDQLVLGSRFILRRVSPVARNGQNLAKIEFDQPLPSDPDAAKAPGYFGGLEGYFVASPDEKWVVLEFECRQKAGARLIFKGTNEYRGTVDGFPMLRRTVRQRFKDGGAQLLGTGTYDFEDLRFVDAPDQEFTLAAFGISNSVAQPSKVARSGSFGYWLIAFAFLALAAALCCKIALSRLRRERST
jgi:hypothetical protein